MARSLTDHALRLFTKGRSTLVVCRLRRTGYSRSKNDVFSLQWLAFPTLLIACCAEENPEKNALEVPFIFQP